MFFLMKLEHDVLLHPRYFGPHLYNTVRQKLVLEVEGQCTGKYGFIITVTGILSIGAGLVQSGCGFVRFPIKYQAVVYRPIKNEVVEGRVENVSKLGLFCLVGPLTVFISRHCIPHDLIFRPTAQPMSYCNEDESIEITVNMNLRLKILGTRVDANNIFAIGTLMDDYLGLSE
ncbi:DNA-directed RNA polymerase II subunit RPB7 [Trichinella pseudospiralis]|uniref:DNA-directed RNA polymerase II subunit RPB7 n=2 Tax=Trichinella pseudospiralis TaxID=6337 RepID=A0A0V1DYS8_TRIPS|nr:DNA-directed RNA polymerase II subunit RPB7 [Trichinella pseudospiralis]KRY66734.1 DNA-directed RNA polymerase II subunit RPB7 [Trichinella pseudospiralis]KRY84197.1 DNA-directed RNA polymerase II subunit RPB7 [Trichinella pseudospiralis]KRZ15767.1 DNA-directed RNA polymerase II subunit RPB7 [Trichinella pseudospiralis]KRZ28357.1 DNA-directed RNA polymerase II subunit RPB7 [Trichinella pseudospiralis]